LVLEAFAVKSRTKDSVLGYTGSVLTGYAHWSQVGHFVVMDKT